MHSYKKSIEIIASPLCSDQSFQGVSVSALCKRAANFSVIISLAGTRVMWQCWKGCKIG